MLLLDLDPNVVKPGWTPLIITVALAAMLVLLYLSMRRQFRKITVEPEDSDPTPAESGAAEETETTPEASTTVDAEAPPGSDQPLATDSSSTRTS